MKPFPIPRTIGDHIRKHRLELRLLQGELADKLAVDECTITNWEKGHPRPMLHLLPKIVEFLGYNPSYNIDEPKTLGEKMLQHRKLHGITQKELAKQIGSDPATLSRIERSRGKYLPSVLKKVSDFLERAEC
ncbi:MAG: transcriptional regulator [Ignavibacteriales bacterium]|nr:transcriptional regulator [Ignavibacteriales bacterium]